MTINTQLSFIQISSLLNLSNNIFWNPKKLHLHQWLPILSFPNSPRNTISVVTSLIGILSKPSDSRMNQVLPTKPSSHISRMTSQKPSPKCWRFTAWNLCSKDMIGQNENRPNPRCLAFDHRDLGCLGHSNRAYFGDEWRSRGIFYAIKLSTIEINLDRELVMAAQSLWCSATNMMVLPLNLIGPTMLYIATILGTSPTSLPIDIFLSWYKFDLDLKTVFEECVIEAWWKKTKGCQKRMCRNDTRTFSTTTPWSRISPAWKGKILRKGNTGLSYSTGTTGITNTSFVPSRISVWPRTCWSPKLASDHVFALSPVVLVNLTRCLTEATVWKIDSH